MYILFYNENTVQIRIIYNESYISFHFQSENEVHLFMFIEDKIALVYQTFDCLFNLIMAVS